MASSNLTPNLNLPQWLDSDKPTWLGDVNSAFKKLDDANGNLVGQVAVLQSRCTSLESRVTALETALARKGS
jgi:hypothetical protein